MKSPTIMTEWIVFAALIGLLASGVVGAVSDEEEIPDETLTSTIEQEDPPPARVFAGPCQNGTTGSDTINTPLEAHCFKLSKGDDIVLLADAAEAVLVDTGQGSSTGGRIETGSGDDTVISQQNGPIITGAGDDLIFLNFTDNSAEPSYFIDPGPGQDSIDVVEATSSETPNIIRSGTGSLDANFLCDAGSIEFQILSGSQSRLNGNCTILARAEESSEMTSLQVSGKSGFSGDFSGIKHLKFNASIENDTGGPVDQPVQLITGRPQYADIHFTAKSSKSVDLEIDGRDLTASSHIYLDLSAPDGHIVLQNIERPDTLFHFDFSEKGVLEINTSETVDPDLISLPDMSGHASHLILRGCFDHTVLLDGTEEPVKWSNCEDPIDISFEDPSRRRNITLVKNGVAARLALGAGSLAAKRLTILAPDQSVPDEASIVIETPEPPVEADLPVEEDIPSTEDGPDAPAAEPAVASET
jgi:hypothetical protein